MLNDNITNTRMVGNHDQSETQKKIVLSKNIFIYPKNWNVTATHQNILKIFSQKEGRMKNEFK